jgi:LytS/YehU family sensor histidine kinase
VLLIQPIIFNKQLAIEPLTLKYQLSKETGDFATALSAFEEMKAVGDSIFTLEKNVKINELEQKYHQAANERSIQDLKWRQRLLFLVCILILGLCLLIFFYFRNRNLKQKQLILEIEQRLNRARMNPHFFFNALSSLQSFAMNESNPISLAENLSKFSHIMRETLESTYRDYVTVKQEIDFLREYVMLQQIRFPDKFEFDIAVSDNPQIEQLLIPSMIVQPFIENSIEHGFKGIQYLGKLEVRFIQDKNGISIHVVDNGKGLQYQDIDPKPYISRASQIIKDRIYLLNLRLKTKASFIIDTNPDERGVSVEIKLPLMYENKNTNR